MANYWGERLSGRTTIEERVYRDEEPTRQTTEGGKQPREVAEEEVADEADNRQGKQLLTTTSINSYKTNLDYVTD